MRLPVLPLLLLVPLAACTADGPSGPRPFRPPATSAFAAGPCALVADDVVTLGRLAHDLQGVDAPDDAARSALRDAQDRLSAVAETAPAPVKTSMDRLVLTSGLVRVQGDTRMLRPEVLANMGTAYDEVVDVCTSGASGSASPAASPAATAG